ncbi:hypothetical protein KXD93_19545 [Mucilaginibacter sp. BJC16-A38]|uniref:hypothetical protein n=1 Tax=Mucilaginibacter phenanthrenivorans TaxID=1234842 RepID=UPI0021581FCD|nr:hypothetical protein [Mucilaginibacter phenanthrenivorans]MCR8559854.1 hypothetical protein [Mucilaginibacter phenanthrenivorans]
MKPLITKAFIFTWLIALTHVAQAQQDYIITNADDSIACKITIPFMGAAKYKKDGMAESKKILPEEIREYCITRKKVAYRAVVVAANQHFGFLPLIEKGKINLYEMIYTSTGFNGQAGYSSKVYYVSKGSDTVNELKTSSLFSSRSRQARKDDFKEMIKDNKTVYDKYMAENSFSFERIRNLIHLYNTGKVLYEDVKPEPESEGFNPNGN